VEAQRPILKCQTWILGKWRIIFSGCCKQQGFQVFGHGRLLLDQSHVPVRLNLGDRVRDC
jgi:hypothetical protein